MTQCAWCLEDKEPAEFVHDKRIYNRCSLCRHEKPSTQPPQKRHPNTVLVSRRFSKKMDWRRRQRVKDGQ